MATPSLVELAVDGHGLALRYSDILNGILPSYSRFQVSVNGFRRAITGPAFLRSGGTTVRLNLASAILPTDTVSVTYTSVNGADKIGFGDIRSLSTNQRASFFRNLTSTNLTGIANTVAVNTSDTSLISGENSLITFAFNRNPGTSFSSGDITVSGGSISNLGGSINTYTATFTPTANIESTASVSVIAASWNDVFDNPGGAAASATMQVDTINPAAAILFSAPAINDTAKTALVTFSFSEKVSGFSAEDISVT
ncbi:MAG: Ig-like domain-containing protein, partial [Cyanobacteriota bacterium]